jgi:Tfp pilus assembly protein PilN
MGNAVNLGSDMGRAGERLGESLHRLAPAFLVRAGLPPQRVRSVLVGALPLTEPAKAALALAGRSGAPVDIRLSRELFLVRSVPLPMAARKDAAGAVALQLRQSMPGQAEGLVWRHVDGPGEAVDVFILKAARLTELLQGAGVTVRRVVIDGVDAVPLFDARHETDWAERFWNRAVPTVVALGLAAVLAVQGMAVLRAEADLAEAEAGLASLRDEAAAARAEAEARNARSAAQMADAARLVRDSRRLALLADLTRVLGDEVWLSSFALDGAVLRISGFSSADVADVLAAVRPLDWVEAVDLDGAVAVDAGSGDRRFQLIVTLRSGGGA